MTNTYYHYLEIRGPVIEVSLAVVRDMARTLDADPTSLRIQLVHEELEAVVLAVYKRKEGAGTSFVQQFVDEVDGVKGTLLWHNPRRNERGYGIFRRQQPPALVQEKVIGLAKRPRLFPDSYPVSPQVDFWTSALKLADRRVTLIDYEDMRTNFPFGSNVLFKDGKPDYASMNFHSD